MDHGSLRQVRFQLKTRKAARHSLITEGLLVQSHHSSMAPDTLCVSRNAFETMRNVVKTLLKSSWMYR